MSLPTITMDRLRKIFDKHKIKHHIDDDGDLIAVWQGGKDCPYDILAILSIGGQKKEILSLTTSGDHQIPEDKQGEVMVACNEWNRERRWPKAYFSAKQSRVIGEWHWDFEHGVDDATLELQILNILGGSFQMFKQLSSNGY